MSSLPKDWCVYMVLCSDNSLYTGITNDISRRFDQHRKGKGAKYFRGRQALTVVYLESGHNRSSASKREWSIKQLNAKEKSALLTSVTNTALNVGPLSEK